MLQDWLNFWVLNSTIFFPRVNLWWAKIGFKLKLCRRNKWLLLKTVLFGTLASGATFLGFFSTKPYNFHFFFRELVSKFPKLCRPLGVLNWRKFLGESGFLARRNSFVQ